MKQIKAWLGFAYDLAKILFCREWDDEPTSPNALIEHGKAETPVVKVGSTAMGMIAPATQPKRQETPAPLEGSIEARRSSLESR